MRADLDKPNAVDGGSPAHIAAEHQNTDMVQLLYDLGADVHRARPDGGRPIHAAAGIGRNDTVLLLFSLRASVDQIGGESGQTPLIMAASYGQTACVRLLCEIRSDVHHVSKEGAPAAEYARQFGWPDTLAVLKEFGA